MGDVGAITFGKYLSGKRGGEFSMWGADEIRALVERSEGNFPIEISHYARHGAYRDLEYIEIGGLPEGFDMRVLLEDARDYYVWKGYGPVSAASLCPDRTTSFRKESELLTVRVGNDGRLVSVMVVSVETGGR